LRQIACKGRALVVPAAAAVHDQQWPALAGVLILDRAAARRGDDATLGRLFDGEGGIAFEDRADEPSRCQRRDDDGQRQSMFHEMMYNFDYVF